MSHPIIEVENLSKRYRLGQFNAQTMREEVEQFFQRLRGKADASRAGDSEFWALKDVSFTVQPGEVLGIIGRNGAGKSTLLKILSRVTEPTSGQARIRGRVASLLEVGTGFHPELTGRENIYLNGTILGMTKAEVKAKFDEIVAFAEIEKFLDTPVKRYSSGMYVRLAFAVAAHLEPEILIVDEVLAVGDAAFQSKCLGKMKDVSNKEGRTVLFVSHNLMAVRALCSRTLVLDTAAVVFDGDTVDAIAHYSGSTKLVSRAQWAAEADALVDRPSFKRIGIAVKGSQPNLVLQADLEFAVPPNSQEFFVAIDISDSSLTPLMQVLPNPVPFIGGSDGDRRLRIEAELPPLIPGAYSLSFWIGAHNTITADYHHHILSFEVVESPTKGRSYPHDPRHGFMAPISRYGFQP